MPTSIKGTMTVKEVLDRHPHLLQTFIDMKLMCVGCPADAFHTLAEVAGEYGLDRREFLSGLQKSIEAAAMRHQQSEAP